MIRGFKCTCLEHWIVSVAQDSSYPAQPQRKIQKLGHINWNSYSNDAISTSAVCFNSNITHREAVEGDIFLFSCRYAVVWVKVFSPLPKKQVKNDSRYADQPAPFIVP